MSSLTIPARLFARRILVPTELGPDGDRAFHHALRIAASIPEDVTLTLLHVGGSREEAGKIAEELPKIRPALIRWGLLPADAPRSAVADVLGIHVNKVVAEQHGPAQTILGYAARNEVDLLVVGTRGEEGLPRWISKSVAETVAQHITAPTLFIPRQARGFVDAQSGAVSMRRILCPVSWEPHPAGAITGAVAAAAGLGEGASTVSLFHVGPPDDRPSLALPELEGVDYEWLGDEGDGDVVDAILAEAGRVPTDLLTMVTSGRDNFLDSLRGTDTQRVIRHAPCPVLAAHSV